MHIFQINASYKPAYIYGGPTMSVSKLAEALISNGIQTEVFTTTANGDTELNVKPGARVILDGVPVTYFRRVSKGNSHLSPALLTSLWNVLRREEMQGRSTIVHIHAWWNLVSVGSAIIALYLSKQVVLSPRGTLSNYSFGNRSSLSKNLFHYIIGKSVLGRLHFHVSTEKEKRDILNIVNPESITVISNFVQLGDDVEDPGLHTNRRGGEKFRLLFLSRIEEKKGVDILFKALAIVQFPFCLTMAGFGTPEYILYLKELSAGLGIDSKITWIGQQAPCEKFQVMASHDLMVLPSHDESFANVVIESLSVGTPVLLTEKVGLADYVIKNGFGWVTPANPEHLSKTIHLAYSDSKKRTRIFNESPSRVRYDFDGKILVQKYIEMYASTFPKT